MGLFSSAFLPASFGEIPPFGRPACRLSSHPRPCSDESRPIRDALCQSSFLFSSVCPPTSIHSASLSPPSTRPHCQNGRRRDCESQRKSSSRSSHPPPPPSPKKKIRKKQRKKRTRTHAHAHTKKHKKNNNNTRNKPQTCLDATGHRRLVVGLLGGPIVGTLRPTTVII